MVSAHDIKLIIISVNITHIWLYFLDL